MISTEELNFLRESNNIEDEWDDMSLQDSILAWQYIKDKEFLTKSNILKTHSLLMNSRDTLEERFKGHYRAFDVYIGGRLGKDWKLVPHAMDFWIKQANDTVEAIGTFFDYENAERRTKHDHIAYEKIHPFGDGNGRTGRIFLNWQRLQVGLPILVIKAGEEQQQYYKWFKND